MIYLLTTIIQLAVFFFVIFELYKIIKLVRKITKKKELITLYITRDKDGPLCLHTDKPNCSESGVWYSDRQLLYLSKNYYPEVTFKNSPRKVELKLK